MRQNHGGHYSAVRAVLHGQLRGIAIEAGEAGARISDTDSTGRRAGGSVETGAVVADADGEFPILQGGANDDRSGG